MKVHTTNYFNTFILIADDSKVLFGEIPPAKKDVPSVANLQFELLLNHPYQFTSDDILFKVFAIRNDLTEQEIPSKREEFFSKGQACFRTSPLTKRYGWGIHFNQDGKMALFGSETQEYQDFMNDSSVTKVKAMKSKILKVGIGSLETGVGENPQSTNRKSSNP